MGCLQRWLYRKKTFVTSIGPCCPKVCLNRDPTNKPRTWPVSKITMNNDWLVVSNMFYFPFQLWDAILPKLTNSIIFQDGNIAPPTRHVFKSSGNFGVPFIFRHTHILLTAGFGNIVQSTLRLFNIAMENGPFIDGSPIKNGDFPWLCQS